MKELLNVSSDWKDVNSKMPGDKASAIGAIPIDFQSQQLEKIVEAISLTLPSGGGNNQSILGGIVGTISSNGCFDSNAGTMRYDDHCIRELAFDLGVDPRALKAKLSSLYSSAGTEDSSQVSKNSQQFHL